MVQVSDTAIDDMIRFFDGAELQFRDDGDAYYLDLENHHPIPAARPRPRRGRLKPRKTAGGYEPVTTLILSYLINRLALKTVLDIGAGGGYFALLAASSKVANPVVHAFDMEPARYDHMVDIYRAADAYGGTIHAHLAGLSDRHYGEKDVWYSITKMFEEKPDPSLYADPWWIRLKFFLRGKSDRDALQHAKIEITSIDHFCRENRLVPDLLKIDVDGYEALVIPGAAQTLRSHHPIIVLELHKNKFYGQFDTTRAKITAPLFDLGYKGLLCSDHNSIRDNIFHPIEKNDPLFEEDMTRIALFYWPE